MSNFDPNAVLRGAQLTLVGAYRALQNPALFTKSHYRQAALAVAAGVFISLLVSVPVFIFKFGIYLTSLVSDLEQHSWDDRVLDTLHFLQNHVLQVPLFLMTVIKHVSPAMDQMFMDSLAWVDSTYVAKHQADKPEQLRAMYYPNLRQWQAPRTPNPKAGLQKLLLRYARKAGLSLSVLLLSYMPFVGKFVLPLASFYTFRQSAGDVPALAIFAAGLVLPRRYLVIFLQAYFSSRSLVRELLEPYLARVAYSSAQKQEWFRDRAGVLFGFGLGFFLLLRIPLVGVLVYGIAEASTAFLITKITEPPPPPSATKEATLWKTRQIRWTNQKEFLRLGLLNLDALNVQPETPADTNPLTTGTGATKLPTKQYS